MDRLMCALALWLTGAFPGLGAVALSCWTLGHPATTPELLGSGAIFGGLAIVAGWDWIFGGGSYE